MSVLIQTTGVHHATRPGDDTRRQTIIVGLGRTSRSAAAVALAARMAASTGARIVLVSVDEGPRGWALWGSYGDAAAAAQLREAYRLRASERLAEAVRDFRLELCDTVTFTCTASVDAALVDTARRFGAAEIVLGPTSRSRPRAVWNRLTRRSSRVETLRRHCPGTAVTVARPAGHADPHTSST